MSEQDNRTGTMYVVSVRAQTLPVLFQKNEQNDARCTSLLQCSSLGVCKIYSNFNPIFGFKDTES